MKYFLPGNKAKSLIKFPVCYIIGMRFVWAPGRSEAAMLFREERMGVENALCESGHEKYQAVERTREVI